MILERGLDGVLSAALVAAEFHSIVHVQMKFERIGLHKALPAVLNGTFKGLQVLVDSFVPKQVTRVVEFAATGLALEALLAHAVHQDVRVESTRVLEDFPAELTNFGAILAMHVLVVEREVAFVIKKPRALGTLDRVLKALSFVLFAVGIGDVGLEDHFKLFGSFFLDDVLLVQVLLENLVLRVGLKDEKNFKKVAKF